MNKADEIYALYKRSFPGIVRGEDVVRKIITDEGNCILTNESEGKLVGVSVIKGNVVYLLCVEESERHKGIGTELLKRSEEYVRSSGFDEIVVGAGEDYIAPGVPMSGNAHLFFIKNGYNHSWGDCGCYDMSCDLSALEYSHHDLGDTIDGITYRWAGEHDISSVVSCAQDGAPEFTQYYANPELYTGTEGSRVLFALENGTAVGAVIVGIETEEKGAGDVGCTVTMKSRRNRGIATTMVKLGTEYLKKLGLPRATLGYTYTALLAMYGRSGYKVSMEYFMAKKPFKSDK